MGKSILMTREGSVQKCKPASRAIAEQGGTNVSSMLPLAVADGITIAYV